MFTDVQKLERESRESTEKKVYKVARQDLNNMRYMKNFNLCLKKTLTSNTNCR